jgi:hypothetical protein
MLITHDPLGLVALPITPIGYDQAADHGSQLGTNAKLLGPEEGSGMPNAAKTIGAALVAVLIAIGLVVPPPAKDSQTVSHCHLEGG